MNLFVLCVLSMVVLGQTSPLIRFKRASEQSASKSQRSPQARNKQITPITLKIIQNNALPTTLLSSRGNPASNHNSDPAPTRDPATAQKSSDQFMNQKLTDEQRILESTKQTTIQEPVDQSPSLECVNLEDTSSHCFVKDEDSKKDSSILIPVSFGEQCLVEAETDDIVKGEIPLICTCLDSTSNTGPLKIISDASPTETDPILCSCKRLTHDPFPATDVFIDSTKRIDDEKFSTNIEKSKSSDILMCSCQKSAIPNSCSINKIFDVKEASPMIENTAVTNPINLECSCKQVNSARDSLEIILEDSKNSLGTDDLNIPSSSSINKNVVIKEASLMTDSTAVANPINLECSCKRANLELEDSGGTSDLNTDCKDSEAALAIVRKSSPDKKIDRTFELTDDSKPSIDLVCSCRDLNSDPGLISNRKAGSFNIDESQSSVNVACSCKKSRENSGLVDSPGPISETLGQKSSESFSCTCQSSKLSSAGTSDPSTITVKAQGTNSECNEKLEDPSDFASCSCSQNQFNSKLSITCTHPANFCGKTNAISGSITNLNVETCDSDATNKCAPESDRTFCRNCNSFNCDCGTSSCHDGNCNHQSSIPVDSALRDCNTPGEVKDSQINNFDGNAVICNDCDRTFCRNCNGFICDCGACSCHGCNCNHQSSTPVDSALRDCNTPGLEVKDSRVNNFDGNAVICNDCDRTFCRNCNGFICDCGACSCHGCNCNHQSSTPVDSALRDCNTPGLEVKDSRVNNFDGNAVICNDCDRTFCRNCNGFICDCGACSCHGCNCNHQSSTPVDSALRDCNTPGEVKDSQINNFDGNAVICNDCDRTFCRNCNGFICDCGACSCHGCNCNHQCSTPVDSALRDCNTPGLEVKDSRVNNFDGNAVICNDCDRTFCRNCNGFICDCGACSCHGCNCNHQCSTPVDSALRDCNTPGLEVKDSRVNNFDGNAVICNDCDRTFCRNCNGFICDCGACSCHGCNCNHQSSTPVDSALRDCNTPGLEVKDSRVNNFDGNAVICNDCDRTFCRNCNGFICDCGACSCHGCNCNHQSSTPVDSALRDCNTPGLEVKDSRVNNFDGNAVICNDCDRTFCRNCNGFICDCGACSCRGGNRHQQSSIPVDSTLRDCDTPRSAGDAQINNCYCDNQRPITIDPLQREGEGRDQLLSTGEELKIGGKGCSRQLSISFIPLIQQETDCDQKPKIDESTNIDGNCDRHQLSQPEEFFCRESTKCESNINGNNCCDQSKQIKSTTIDGNCDRSQSSQPGEYCCRESTQCESKIKNNKFCDQSERQEGNCDQQSVRSELNGNNSNCLLPQQCLLPIDQKIFKQKDQGSECTELETNNSGFCPYQLVSVHPPSSDPEMHRQQNSAPHFTSQNDGRISSDPDQSGAQTQASNATETRFSINDCSTKPPVIPSMCAFIMYPRMNVSNLDPTKISSQLSSNPMLFTPFEFNKVDQIVCCN